MLPYHDVPEAGVRLGDADPAADGITFCAKIPRSGPEASAGADDELLKLSQLAQSQGPARTVRPWTSCVPVRLRVKVSITWT